MGEFLAAAEKENISVFFRIPLEYHQLTPVQPAAMVKPLAPQTLETPPSGPGVQREDYFSMIVPDSHTKTLSRYTDMVDSVVRDQMALLEAVTDEDRLRLNEWELPGALEALTAGSAASLPESIRAPMAAWDESGGWRGLEDLLVQLRTVREAAEGDLDHCEDQLNREEQDDASFRQTYGPQWTRAPSASINGSLRDQIAQYRATLSAAATSDAKLAAKVESMRARMEGLNSNSAAASMPRLKAPLVTMGDTDPAQLVVQLRAALSRLNQLSGDRAALEDDLKLLRDQDNILPKLLAHGANPGDDLLERELGKYNPVKDRVADHLAQHAELLRELGTLQQQYKDTFQYSAWQQECKNAAQGIRDMVQRVGEIQGNIEEGFQFYTSVQDRLRLLSQNIGDFAMTRRIERDDLVAAIRGDSEKRMAALSLGSRGQQSQSRQQAPSRPLPPPPPPAPTYTPAAGGSPISFGFQPPPPVQANPLHGQAASQPVFGMPASPPTLQQGQGMSNPLHGRR